MMTFIDAHRVEYGVEPICRVLPIAPSTYYLHTARQADPERRPARAKADAVLTPAIQRVWEENYAVYGVRKVWQALRREQVAVARCTVERLMRRLGLRGVIRGKGGRTTVPADRADCPVDHVKRQFQAHRRLAGVIVGPDGLRSRRAGAGAVRAASVWRGEADPPQ